MRASYTKWCRATTEIGVMEPGDEKGDRERDVREKGGSPSRSRYPGGGSVAGREDRERETSGRKGGSCDSIHEWLSLQDGDNQGKSLFH